MLLCTFKLWLFLYMYIFVFVCYSCMAPTFSFKWNKEVSDLTWFVLVCVCVCVCVYVCVCVLQLVAPHLSIAFSTHMLFWSVNILNPKWSLYYAKTEASLASLSVISFGQSRGHNPIKWDLKWPSRPSFTFSLQQHLVYHNTHSNVEDYKIENKMYADTENGWKKIMTASISVSSSCQVSSQMTTGRAGYHLLCCSSLENDACTLFQSIQTFCEQQIHWEFPLSNIIALSFVFDTCVHHVLLISIDTTKVVPYIPECLICGSFHFWGKFQGVYLTPRCSL